MEAKTKKERIGHSSIIKLYKKNEKKGNIYVWHIFYVYWIADMEMIESFLIGLSTNMIHIKMRWKKIDKKKESISDEFKGFNISINKRKKEVELKLKAYLKSI